MLLSLPDTTWVYVSVGFEVCVFHYVSSLVVLLSLLIIAFKIHGLHFRFSTHQTAVFLRVLEAKNRTKQILFLTLKGIDPLTELYLGV